MLPFIYFGSMPAGVMQQYVSSLFSWFSTEKNKKAKKAERGKFMSKKDCFYDVVKLFKGYENTKKSLNAEYESMKNTGIYSRQYLNGISAEHDKRLREENSRVISRISGIREKLEKELDKEFDLTATKPDAGLQALVNSGIAPTEKEFANLAQKYKGNYVNSRLLHDFADKNGYILRNITTREEAEQAFDNFARGVCDSMYAINGFPIYSDSGYAQIKADSYLNSLENPALDCYKKPETFEETIAQGMAMDRVDKERAEPEIDDEAFLRGFWGEKMESMQKKAETDGELEDDIKALTAEERADAKHLSHYFGNKGEITQRELDYLKSENYKKAVEERNAKNGENNE